VLVRGAGGKAATGSGWPEGFIKIKMPVWQSQGNSKISVWLFVPNTGDMRKNPFLLIFLCWA
jgi:hypothetical protein